jgi:hypothetical protein
MRTLTLSIALLTLCTAQAAFAQDAGTGATTGSGTVTGSGEVVRTTEDVVQTIREHIPNRNPKRLRDVVVPDAKQKGWEKDIADARTRLASHRRDCRESVRRANRDQVINTLTNCYSGNLQQDMFMLRKHLMYVQAIPTLDPVTRSNATGALLKLIDAEQTIVDAINTGLFTSQEALEQAKKNLRLNYSVPYWASMTKLRADWELTWVTFMVKNIEERLAEPDLKGAKAQLIHEAAVCLENSASMLITARDFAERISASQTLTQATVQLQECRKTLANIARREQQEDAEKAENQESQQ